MTEQFSGFCGNFRREFRRADNTCLGAVLQYLHHYFPIVPNGQLQDDAGTGLRNLLVVMPMLLFYQLGSFPDELNFGYVARFALEDTE